MLRSVLQSRDLKTVRQHILKPHKSDVLDTEQQTVVNSREGIYALLASPGSGKTTTVIARYKALLDAGIPARDILCLTFTKEAAKEMEKRAGKGNFRTFHSFAYSVVIAEAGKQNLEPELRNRLLAKLSRKWHVDFRDLVKFISSMKHRATSPSDSQFHGSIRLAKAYNEYEQERNRAGWIDFEDMLMDAIKLLSDPCVRARYQFKFIMIDEAQDSDVCNWKIAELVSEKHGNILAVGDVKQAMYGFRDAVVHFDEYMARRWQTKVLHLSTNYRSTSPLIRYMNTHYPLYGPPMIAARTSDGPIPEYKKFASDFDEAEEALAIASKNPENTAILARTNRLLAPLESTALEHGLKYHLLGRSGFWVQREIRKVIEKLSPFGGMPIETALNIVLPEIHKHYEVEDATAEDNSAIENLKALREIAARKPQPTSEFISYANRCANVKKKGGITLSTVHQAKGREWGTVIVIGTAEGQLPHAKGSFDEEKRIFFVAISRAKDRLRITWCGRHSQFLNPDLSKETLDKLMEECYSFERIQKQLSLV